MRVKYTLRALLTNKITLLGVGLVIIVVIFITTSSFVRPSELELSAKHVNLSIREIGHRLLLEAGDSTSRILPVKEISEGVFLLEFEHNFAFKPDTLIALTRRQLAKTGLKDYTVTVYECFNPEIVYGFQIGTTTDSLEPCHGRVQPRRCYTIQIAFADFNRRSLSYTPIALGLAGLVFAFGIVVGARHFKANPLQLSPEKEPVDEKPTDQLALGALTFDIQRQQILSGGEVIALTDKECKVLELLHRNFGALTPREDLIQQVWIDEGVITGRSLDMFVSKLRKKLSADANLRITNVHGKGYKLEAFRNM